MPSLTDPYASLAVAESGDEAALLAVADSIKPAFAILVKTDRPAAMRLVGALAWYWQDTGLVNEGRRMADRVLEGAHRLAVTDAKVAAAIPGALLAASELAFRQSDQEAARVHGLAAIRAAVLIEDYRTAALAHVNLARVAFRAGDAPAIEKHARKSLDMGGDDTLARRGGLHMLAWAAHTAGRLDEAEKRFEESLEYRRAVNAGPVSIASEISNLGDLAAERGDLPRAASLLAEALSMSGKARSTYMVVNLLPSLASLAERAGLRLEAVRLIGAADAASKSSGLKPDPGGELEKERADLAIALGEDRYGAELERGASLSTEEAVALATRVAERLKGSEDAPV